MSRDLNGTVRRVLLLFPFLLLLLAGVASAAAAPAGPKLTFVPIRSANVGNLPLSGQTDPGATVTVNGAPVTVKSDGTFTVRLKVPAEGLDITLAAVDAAGNRTEVKRHIVLTGEKYWDDRGLTPLTETVQPGSRVTLYKGTSTAGSRQLVGALRPDENGEWTGMVVQDLGLTTYWFEVVTPSGEEYDDVICRMHPYNLAMPDMTNLSDLAVWGRTLPGWKISLNQQPVDVAADGTFKLKLTPGPGKQTYKVRVDGSLDIPLWASWDYVVDRISDPNPLFTAKISLADQEPGAIFMDDENNKYPVDGRGRVDIPLTLKKGLNRTVLLFVTPDGHLRSHVLDLTYTPSKVITLGVGKFSADVNGDVRDLLVPPMIRNGFTYVPLRFLGELLGAKVDWEAETRSVTYVTGSHAIRLAIGESVATVDGETKSLPAPVVIVDGRTMVPLRFISENLGAKVMWDGIDRTITVAVPDP